MQFPMIHRSRECWKLKDWFWQFRRSFESQSVSMMIWKKFERFLVSIAFILCFNVSTSDSIELGGKFLVLQCMRKKYYVTQGLYFFGEVHGVLLLPAYQSSTWIPLCVHTRQQHNFFFKNPGFTNSTSKKGSVRFLCPTLNQKAHRATLL